MREPEARAKLERGVEETVVGRTFKTPKGVQFTVLEDTFYRDGKNDRTNGPYLEGTKRGRSEGGKLGEGEFFQKGQLASVFYQSWATPFVRGDGGVMKLEQMRVGDEVITKAHEICAKLDILDSRRSVSLEEIK